MACTMMAVVWARGAAAIIGIGQSASTKEAEVQDEGACIALLC
jgi:hypothetical protein